MVGFKCSMHAWSQWLGRTDRWLQINRLSLRNSRLEVEDFREITDHFRRIYGIYLKLVEENRKSVNM